MIKYFLYRIIYMNINYAKTIVLLIGLSLFGGGIYTLSRRNLTIFNYMETYPNYLMILSGLIMITMSSYYNFTINITEGLEDNVNNVRSDLEVIEPIRSQEPEHSKAEIVLFYALWCGYSKDFLATWKEFVEIAKRDFPELKLTEIRCEGDNENFCNQVGVKGFPTIVLYSGDNQYMFTKQRTIENLVEFVNSNMKK